MCIDCEAIIMSAMERKESRGAHTRSDYAQQEDKWLVNIVTAEKNGALTRTLVPVPKPPLELASLIRTGD
jgi:succinate dehydrogenase / fumarate reductase flavoprotein subunit